MDITVYALPDCPFGAPAVENVRRALAAENIKADVPLIRIEGEAAAAKGLSGSPAVVINGKELQPSGSPVFQ